MPGILAFALVLTSDRDGMSFKLGLLRDAAVKKFWKI